MVELVEVVEVVEVMEVMEAVAPGWVLSFDPFFAFPLGISSP